MPEAVAGHVPCAIGLICGGVDEPLYCSCGRILAERFSMPMAGNKHIGVFASDSLDVMEYLNGLYS